MSWNPNFMDKQEAEIRQLKSKIEALEASSVSHTPFKANDIELLFNTRKEIAEMNELIKNLLKELSSEEQEK